MIAADDLHRRGDADIFKRLKESPGIDTEHLAERVAEIQLYHYAKAGDMGMVTRLLQSPGVDVNARGRVRPQSTRRRLLKFYSHPTTPLLS